MSVVNGTPTSMWCRRPSRDDNVWTRHVPGGQLVAVVEHRSAAVTHLSVVFRDVDGYKSRLPTWAELADARDTLLDEPASTVFVAPDRFMQVTESDR